MILKALYDYYQRSGEDVAPLGLEYKQIGFIIVLDKDGHFFAIRRQTFGQEVCTAVFGDEERGTIQCPRGQLSV